MKIVTNIENIKQEDERSIERYNISDENGYPKNVKVLGHISKTFYISNNSNETIKEVEDLINNSIDDKLVFDLIIEDDKAIKISCTKRCIRIKNNSIAFYECEIK